MAAIYVSHKGDDASGDGSLSRPYRTIGKAIASIDDIVSDGPYRGSATKIFVERGGIYPPVAINRDGLPPDDDGSPAQHLWVMGYGSGGTNPVIVSNGDRPCIEFAGASRRHITINGLAMTSGLSAEGIRAIGNIDPGHSNLSIQNCHIYRCRGGINIQRAKHVSILNCIIEDNYSPTVGRVHGIYMEDVPGVIISGCTIQRNGWDIRDTATRSIYNHGIYIRQRRWFGLWDGWITRNRLIDNSSFGVGVSTDERPGQTPCIEGFRVIGNLFVGNANGFVHGAKYADAIVSSTIINNTFVYLGGEPGNVPQSHAMILKGMRGGAVQGNIFAHPIALPETAPIRSIVADEDPVPQEVDISHNVFVGYPYDENNRVRAFGTVIA